MIRIAFIVIFLFASFTKAENKLVLECFPLNDEKYEFKYYGIINGDLYYLNNRKIVTKIPHKSMRVKENKMFASTSMDALIFEMVGSYVDLKRVTKKGKKTNYACSKLNNRDLKEFENR